MTASRALLALAVLLAAEAVFLVVTAASLVLDLVAGRADSAINGLAFIVIVLVAALFVSSAAVGAFRGRTWIRAASIVWQILQAIAGLAAFQGILDPGFLGVPLIVVAIVAFALTVSPAVTRATAADRDGPADPEPPGTPGT